MIENYIYYKNEDNFYKSDLIDFLEDYSYRLDNDSKMNLYIRLFNEDENIIQFQIQRDNKEFHIFNFEISDDYISIIHSIIDSNESDIIEENIELFKIRLNRFNHRDLELDSIINFFSNYLFELYSNSDYSKILEYDFIKKR